MGLRKPDYAKLTKIQIDCAEATKKGGVASLPTGTGKSHAIGRNVAYNLSIADGKSVWIVSPSHIVTKQNQVAFSKYSETSVYSPKLVWHTYQSFLNAWEKIMKRKQPERSIPFHISVDEYHHANDETGLVGKEAIFWFINRQVPVSYYSATPWDKGVHELWGMPKYSLNYQEAVEIGCCSNLKIVVDTERLIYLLSKKVIIFANAVDEFPHVSNAFKAFGPDRMFAEMQTRNWENETNAQLLALRRLGEGYSPPGNLYGVILPNVVRLPTRAMQLAGRAARCSDTEHGYVYCPDKALSALYKAEGMAGAKWIWE